MGARWLRGLGTGALLSVALVAGCRAAGAAPAAAAPIKHVWLVVLENESYGTTFAANTSAPYLARTLPANGALVSQYYAIGHQSLDNYIALISGQAPNPNTQADCPDYIDLQPGTIGSHGQALGMGCVYPSSVQTLAGQLQAKGLGWKGYMQDMGNDPTREAATCGHPAVGSADGTQKATAKDNYAARHDPFVYFHSIIDSPVCNQRVVPLTALPHDLASEADTPAFSFITPSLCDDGHDAPCADGRPGGLVSADAFLRAWLPRITSSPAFNDGGLVIVTFDEAETSDAGACCGEGPGLSSPLPGIFGAGGGRIGAVMLSPYIRPGTTSTLPYNHYSLLRSVEDMFGLGHLGMAGASGLGAFGADVFTQPGGPPAGAPPLLQGPTALGGAGSGKDTKAPLGCRSAALPRPRKGRYRRGTLLAAASVTRYGGRPTLSLRLNHPARVRASWRGSAVSRRLHACRVYRLALPRYAGRVTIVARAGKGLERRLLQG